MKDNPSTNVGISISPSQQTFLLSWPTEIVTVWQMDLTLPGSTANPADSKGSSDLYTVNVPGTVSVALQDQPITSNKILQPLHYYDIWYHTKIQIVSGDKVRFRGLAGLAEIWIANELVMFSTNMFTYTVIQPGVIGEVSLSLCFRSLIKALCSTTGRSRWRTQLVTLNALRFFRQTLLGHMPGWCPSIHAIGPYRLVEQLRGSGTLQNCVLNTTMRDQDGVVTVRLVFLEPVHQDTSLKIRSDHYVAPLYRVDAYTFSGVLVVATPELWWPHTHGNSKLYNIFLSDGVTELFIGHTGFRKVQILHGDDGDGFQFEVNGTPIFCRGACWTSADLIGLKNDRATYLPWLQLVKSAGMNMIRIGGTMLYEGKELHDLCDELGILVWQDLMFACLDYPMEDVAFRETVIIEVEQLIKRLSASPSLVILCGGSEMAQQATMLGLQVDRRSMPFLETDLPDLIYRLKQDLVYIPNSPWGGVLPINVNAGVAHYYGVGAYEKPLEDARRAGVRFATECLAFANLPDTALINLDTLINSPRDPGSTWTFADTRDFYLRQLYMVDPRRLRTENPQRYFDLSRAVTADVMEATFAEWRRPGSSCAGGIVWQLQDLTPGSGWGVIDNNGNPKSAWHGLCRVLAPIQILMSDEGVNGIDVHVLNETSQPLMAIVQLTCFSHAPIPILTTEQHVIVPARGSVTLSSYTLCDGFFDINRTYRFGPSEHIVTVATLRCGTSYALLSQAFHFPVGRALPLDDLDLVAEVVRVEDNWTLEVATRRFAQGVHLEIDGYLPAVNWFHLPPFETRLIGLSPASGSVHPPIGRVCALNSRTSVPVRIRS